MAGSVKAFGWAARDPSGVLSPFDFSRRPTGNRDVQFKNHWGFSTYLMLPGHEVVGVVTEVGRKCANNLENYCPQPVTIYNSVLPDGTSTYGGYSDIMVADEDFVIRWPENLPMDKAAPLLYAGITTYSSLRYYGLDKPGLHSGVVGLGHVTVKFAKAFGSKVTVISTSSREAEMQAAAGTLDGIIDTVSAHHAIEPLLSLLKPHGKLIILGGPEKPLELSMFSLIMGRKMVGGSDPPRSRLTLINDHDHPRHRVGPAPEDGSLLGDRCQLQACPCNDSAISPLDTCPMDNTGRTRVYGARFEASSSHNVPHAILRSYLATFLMPFFFLDLRSPVRPICKAPPVTHPPVSAGRVFPHSGLYILPSFKIRLLHCFVLEIVARIPTTCFLDLNKGPSIARSRSRSRSQSRSNPSNNPSDDETPRYVRYQQSLDNSPWIGIVSKVKQSISQIKEKYFIPHDFEVLIPRSFDRMHTPPVGFCTLSIGHFEAGFRLPLAPPVARILKGLRLNPMQLSPNSISHIVLFVIIMRAFDLDPSFDNFWSIYSFTTSTRSTNRGFFYLTFRRQCRYLEPLKSNTGPWKDRFIFVRPPPSQQWPFTLKWSAEKPEPVTEGEGLDGDLINSLTSNPFFPKKLLTEEVFCLARLSRASVPITWSLENKVMLGRLTKRARARQERATGEVQPTPPQDQAPGRTTPQRPDSDTSATPTADLRRPKTPVDIGSEEVQAHDLPPPVRGASPSIEMVGSLVEGGAAGPSRPRKPARAAEDENLKSLKEVEEWELSAFAAHRTDSQKSAELTGARLAPHWKVSDHSTILNSEAGQESYEIYRHTSLSRDQAALLSYPYPRLEQHGAHALAQASAFMRSLSLKCTVQRKRRLEAQEKYREIRNDCRAKEKEWAEERQRLEEAKARLEAEVAEAHGAEVARAREEGQMSGFSAGQEAGLIQGCIEGREDFLNSAEFADRVRSARLGGARDFLKTPVFYTAVEIKASIYMTGF
ncbi:UNVERIFIED_CONTAM: 8-hydroxygeraniol dehydrogenase [Sesamum indicum]